MTIRTISVREARRLGDLTAKVGDVHVPGTLPGATDTFVVVLNDPEDPQELVRVLTARPQRRHGWGTP